MSDGQPGSTSIGIMSMQRIHNYGSFLQAFSLRRMIESTAGDVRVSFVDFRPGQPLVTAGVGGVSPFRRTLAKLADYGRVDAGVSDRVRFMNHKRRFGHRYFPLLGLTSTPDFAMETDVLVIGSDEVFNCVQSNANVGYTRDLFGHRWRNGSLISYAGSFGNTTLEKIEQFGIRAEIAEDLARFDALSVRDENSAQIVEALTERRPQIHIDPALAYGCLTAEPRIPGRRLYDAPYIIVYAYAGRLSQRENDLIRDYARREGASVLCLGGVQACGDRFVDCSPFELLAYFRDAAGVVTDTFHGAIFSLLYGLPFASLIRPSRIQEYGNEEKLGYLLRQFGAETHRVEDLTELKDVLSRPPDDARIQETLVRERSRSSLYLERSIRGSQRR